MQVGLLYVLDLRFRPGDVQAQLGAGSINALQGPGDVSKVTSKGFDVIRIV